MQLTRLYKLIIFGVAAVLLSSCNKNNTQGKFIPKEAAVVIHLNGKSLSSKLPWDEIKQNPLFREMNSDTSLPATLKSLLNNPDNSGIDIQSDLMIFAIKDSIGGYICFEGKIKDESIFKTINKQLTEKGVKSEKDGVQYISKFPVCVGWTKENFIYVFDAFKLPKMNESSKSMMNDSNDIPGPSARDIGATCKAVFALKESNSLAKDEKFTRLIRETGDVHFWMNTEQLGKGSISSTAMAFVNLDKFYKGNITTATMNFDNGKMLLNVKTYAGEEILSLFKKYSGGKINEDMIRRMPGKDIVAVLAVNFKPEAVRELIKMTGLDGLVNLGAEKLGFSINDFINANKGDILFGISDLVLKPDTTNQEVKGQYENLSFSHMPDVNIIFAASIGEKEAFNKLVNAGKKLGQGFLGDTSKLPVSFNSNGNYFAISNNKKNVDQFLGTTTTNFDFIPKITGEPVGGYLNIQMLLKSTEWEAGKDSAAKIAYEASIKMWDNVLWKGGNYSDGGILQHVEINLVDKTTNSLKQLNQYAAKLNELYKEERRKKKEEIRAFENFGSEKKYSGLTSK